MALIPNVHVINTALLYWTIVSLLMEGEYTVGLRSPRVDFRCLQGWGETMSGWVAAVPWEKKYIQRTMIAWGTHRLRRVEAPSKCVAAQCTTLRNCTV